MDIGTLLLCKTTTSVFKEIEGNSSGRLMDLHSSVRNTSSNFKLFAIKRSFIHFTKIAENW
jgi:hypothetical protein